MSALPPVTVRKPGFLTAVQTEGRTGPADFGRALAAPVAAPARVEAPAPTPPPLPTPPPASGMNVALAGLQPPPSPPRPSAPTSFADPVRAVEQLERERQRLAALARADALEVGFMVAERILGQELAANPRPLLELVRSAMQRLGDSREVTVRLSPTDHDRLAAIIAAGEPAAAGVAKVRLEADPQLGPGDCRVHSERGSVDGGLHARLGEVRRSIGAMESEEP
jgi:hypothetical protein